jgi:hypothetical protein
MNETVPGLPPLDDGPGLTFERWNRLLGFLPAPVRCWLHRHLPRRLEQQAWDHLRREAMRANARAAGMTHITEPLEAELARLRLGRDT